MEYLYDIFISHNKGKVNKPWLKKILPSFLEAYPNNELPDHSDQLIGNSVLPSG